MDPDPTARQPRVTSAGKVRAFALLDPATRIAERRSWPW